MENELTSIPKQTETRTHLMTGKTIVYLLVPSILFFNMAVLALYYAASYIDMAEGKDAVAHNQKMERAWDELAAKIAAGGQEPTRENLMIRLHNSGAAVSAWQSVVPTCARTMRQIAIGVLIGVVIQFFVIFRVRAHYKKLATGAVAN